MKLIQIFLMLVFGVAAVNPTYASDYKRMQCWTKGDEDSNIVAEYVNGIFGDEIKLNYYNVGVTVERNCSKLDFKVYGETKFEGIDYPKAHIKRCSIEDGIYFSRSERKSKQGHVLITEVKINFLTKHNSYGRWVCLPGQSDNCPSKVWSNPICSSVE